MICEFPVKTLLKTEKDLAVHVNGFRSRIHKSLVRTEGKVGGVEDSDSSSLRR